MSIRYHVMVVSEMRQEGNPSAEGEGVTREIPILSLYVDQLYEVAAKLTALYPAPVVKRAHRRKAEART